MLAISGATRTMEERKKGLRDPMDEAQVRKAVAALQAFREKQRGAEKKKHELIASTEYISCIVTRKLIPAKPSLKPIAIDVPHALYGADNNDAEICLFVKDTDKDRIKKALAEHPVPGLAKVMAVKKLRKNFKRFEDRRTLAGAYDMFLADDRILPYLKTPLGSKFFVKKKQPIAVRVSRADVSSAVRAVVQRTAMHVSAGACMNVKVAHFGLSDDQIVENIVVGMTNCAAHIPKGWLGIQSISIKTNDSIALPIYNALADMSKLPPVASKKSQLKRKLDDVEPTKNTKVVEAKAEEVETPAAPVAKKQKASKTTPVKKAGKTAPVKAVTPEPKAKVKTTPETKTKAAEPKTKKQKAVLTPVTTPEPIAKKQKASPSAKKAAKTTNDKTPTPTSTKKTKKTTPSKK